VNDLPKLVAVTPVGERVKIKIRREGKVKTFTVKIGELKEEIVAKEKIAPVHDLGIEVSEITPSMASRLGINKGMVVARVTRGSPAYEAGLRRGDVILEISKKSIMNADDYYKIMQQAKPGDTLLFFIKRQEGTLFIPLQTPKGG
jgi:serine protease Do